MQLTADAALADRLEGRLVQSLIALGARASAAVAYRAYQLRGDLAALEMTHDLAYGSDPAQRFDVWRPRAAASTPRPLVLFLHGGGFQQLDRASHWPFAARFAQAGAVVMNADYRLAPAHPFPAAADDAARMLARARELAARFGADPEQLVIAGASAGANLALGCAIRETAAGKPPRACVLFSGLLQVSDIARLYRHQPVARPLRARMATIARDYVGVHAISALPDTLDARLDPLLHLERQQQIAATFPAVFCSTGTRDQVYDDSERLTACLERHGLHGALDVVAGGGHAFQGLLFQERVRALWGRCFAFLREAGVPLAG